MATELLLKTNFRWVVAKRLGLSAKSFKRWMRLGEEYPGGIYSRFRDAVLKAEAEAECRAVSAIYSSGIEGQAQHLEWLLERKYPNRWGKYRGELVGLQRRLKELEKEVARERAADET